MQQPVEVDLTAHAALSLLALFSTDSLVSSPSSSSLKRKAEEVIVAPTFTTDQDEAESDHDQDGAGSDEYISAPGSPRDDDEFSPYQPAPSRKSSSYATSLASSRKRHANKEPKTAMRFVCDQCGYATNHNWLLKRHHLTHSGEKPYVCNVCSKAFRQSAHLSGHMKIHTGEKSWLCCDCGESFKRSDTLQKHRLTHSKKSSSSSRDRAMSPSGSPSAPSSPAAPPLSP